MINHVLDCKNMDAYIPVSCSFHDELEALATLRQACQIVYHDANEIKAIHSRIVDIYAANHADFIRLQDGTDIRLDRLISVNDKQLADYTDA